MPFMTNPVIDSEQNREGVHYIEDPNEAVKEVLRQILDEESKKGNGPGMYGL
jgi:hypothetical protein